METKHHYNKVYHKGKEIRLFLNPEETDDIELHEDLRKRIFSLYHRMETGERNGYLFFDLDGVLIAAGVETAAHDKTLEQYIKENSEHIERFKREIESLKKLGFRVAINTGRGGEFARRIAREYFPPHTVDKIICEGGAEIISYEKKGNEILEEKIKPASIEEESLEIFEQHKDGIINHVLKHLNGELEGGKEVILSFNSEKGKDINVFFEEVKSFLKQIDVIDKIEATHSATAVDITPKGADKLKALVEVLEDDMSIYFGDAKSDEDAMRRSVINVVPANGRDSTKHRARNSTFGIISEKDEIEGIAHSLRTIDMFFRLAERYYKTGGKK